MFTLTASGQAMADALLKSPAYSDLAQRADLTYSLFNRFGGTKLKDFIYEHFPEVVGLDMNEPI